MMFTMSEMNAYMILGNAGKIPGYHTTKPDMNPHDAGNKIIELAEKIKAERQVAILEKK